MFGGVRALDKGSAARPSLASYGSQWRLTGSVCRQRSTKYFCQENVKRTRFQPGLLPGQICCSVVLFFALLTPSVSVLPTELYLSQKLKNFSID